MVAAAGGALGMAVAAASLRTFVMTAPIELPRVSEVAIDGRVMAFAAVATMAAGVLTALLPAWRLAGGDVQGALRGGGLATTGDRASLRTRGTLLAVQVALSMSLLVVTALLGLSFVRLMRIDRGFSADHVLAVDVALPSSRYDSTALRTAAYDRMLAAVAALPGVDAVSFTSVLPLKGEDWTDLVSVTGDTRPIFERPIVEVSLGGARVLQDALHPDSPRPRVHGSRSRAGSADDAGGRLRGGGGAGLARAGRARETVSARQPREAVRSGRDRSRCAHDRDRCAAGDDGLRPVLVPQPRRGGAGDSHGRRTRGRSSRRCGVRCSRSTVKSPSASHVR